MNDLYEYRGGEGGWMESAWTEVAFVHNFLLLISDRPTMPMPNALVTAVVGASRFAQESNCAIHATTLFVNTSLELISRVRHWAYLLRRKQPIQTPFPLLTSQNLSKEGTTYF